jgi:hypothetical protein
VGDRLPTREIKSRKDYRMRNQKKIEKPEENDSYRSQNENLRNITENKKALIMESPISLSGRTRKRGSICKGKEKNTVAEYGALTLSTLNCIIFKFNRLTPNRVSHSN